MFCFFLNKFFYEFLNFFFSSLNTSEGVVAYYWSQFEIPVSDLEIVPEFSEERVLEALEKSVASQSTRSNLNGFKIIEITASRKYLQNHVYGESF